jgi:phosphoserine phosphatase
MPAGSLELCQKDHQPLKLLWYLINPLEDNTLATRVIILRHGQSSYNSQGRIQGRCNDSTLTEKGIADAITTGKALDGLHLGAIYCSPLQRASATAQQVLAQVAGAPTPIAHDHLKEVDLPPWEGMLFTELAAQFPKEYQLWHERPHELVLQVNGQEHRPIASLYAQATEFWQSILPNHKGKTILIVAHNGINRALLSTALGIPMEMYQSIQQSNCAISVLNFSDGWGSAVQLESLNQVAHMGMALPEVKSAIGPRFLIVRHGETDWNRAGRFQGQIDVPLNDHGRSQAACAREFLKDVPMDFAFTSPMLRPKETAEIILQAHPDITLQTNADLQEISHGLWEGKLESEIAVDYAQELEDWRTKPETVQMPEGENLQDVWQRAGAAWQDLVSKVGDVPQTGIVVAHDATNKVLLCQLMGLRLEDFWKIKQGNGAVTVVSYSKGIQNPPMIQCLNVTSHLSGGILDKTAAGAL